SDLCIIDLRNNHMRVMDEVNSDNVDSYHSWSSNGKWIVFSSKREEGLWARPYIAYFDQATGYAHKPFVLPQSNPGAYLDELNSYNIPEFATSKIDQDAIRTLFTE
ncbi:MAG: TolB family protein, partial [Tannerellaceae bacterium]